MKIRNGFVSNSSSSSFCIYGAEIEVTVAEEDDGDDDAYETASEEMAEKAEKMGLSVHNDYENNSMYIGREWSSVGDNETGSQFKKDVEKKLEKLTGKKQDCDTIDETIPC